MRHQPSLVLAFISILLLSIKPYEACRSVPRDNEQVWIRKKHLLLLSLQWNTVTPPASNPGTNNAVYSATLGEKNSAATKRRRILKTHLLLPSLWKPVIPPKSNTGTNSALAEAKNFAAGLPPRKKSNHLLLPSLQWRPVTPPSTNPGHNAVGTVSEQNFVGGKMTIHPPPSSKHHKRQLPLSRKATS